MWWVMEDKYSEVYGRTVDGGLCIIVIWIVFREANKLEAQEVKVLIELFKKYSQ